MSWFTDLFKQPPNRLEVSHRMLRANFTYVGQPGEWDTGRVYLIHRIDRPVKGDCDDWAASMAVAVGLSAEYVEFYLPDGRYHAACLYDGWISDCLRPEPYQLGNIQLKLRLAVSEVERYGRRV